MEQWTISEFIERAEQLDCKETGGTCRKVERMLPENYCEQCKVVDQMCAQYGNAKANWDHAIDVENSVTGVVAGLLHQLGLESFLVSKVNLEAAPRGITSHWDPVNNGVRISLKHADQGN